MLRFRVLLSAVVILFSRGSFARPRFLQERYDLLVFGQKRVWFGNQIITMI